MVSHTLLWKNSSNKPLCEMDLWLHQASEECTVSSRHRKNISLDPDCLLFKSQLPKCPSQKILILYFACIWNFSYNMFFNDLDHHLKYFPNNLWKVIKLQCIKNWMENRKQRVERKVRRRLMFRWWSTGKADDYYIQLINRAHLIFFFWGLTW